MTPIEELEAFDWFTMEKGHSIAPIERTPVDAVKDETPYERKLRMLRHLSLTCQSCSMCELGLVPAVKNYIARNPHVLSNMNPVRVMCVGQNPGWSELEQRQPFVGPSGKNFDTEIGKHGLTRNDFYITNCVKCFTPNNVPPSNEYITRCKPYLDIEINLIKPKLIITLGSPSFNVFCPNSNYGSSLKTIQQSPVFNVPVFPIYHPSPLNLSDQTRKTAFADQIRVMCMLVKRINNADSNSI